MGCVDRNEDRGSDDKIRKKTKEGARKGVGYEDRGMGTGREGEGAISIGGRGEKKEQ